MERLKLNVLALVPQEVHHHLEVSFVRDVSGHHVEVGAIEEDLAKQLQGLPLGDVVGRHDELGVGGKELGVCEPQKEGMAHDSMTYAVVVLVQIISDHGFMSR